MSLDVFNYYLFYKVDIDMNILHCLRTNSLYRVNSLSSFCWTRCIVQILIRLYTTMGDSAEIEILWFSFYWSLTCSSMLFASSVLSLVIGHLSMGFVNGLEQLLSKPLLLLIEARIMWFVQSLTMYQVFKLVSR